MRKASSSWGEAVVGLLFNAVAIAQRSSPPASMSDIEIFRSNMECHQYYTAMLITEKNTNDER